MENKEKQILAIAQDLSDCLEYDVEDSSIVDTYDTAYNLVNKGWVKLSEDSVILSKEDKAKLVHINALKNIKSISQLKELLSSITAINDLMGYNDRELGIKQEENKE